jgi:two-component system NtrC family sensor kinase
MTIRFRLTIAAIAGLLVASSILSLVAFRHLSRTLTGEIQIVFLLVFLAGIGGAALASLVFLLLTQRRVLRPIHHIVEMAQKVIGGDMTARAGIRPPGEMGVLCRAVDSMAQAVAEREELLQHAAHLQTRRSEQLAVVGRLAAGVAHEINNPLTGILVFAELMRAKENLDAQDREGLDVIIRETIRARDIVGGLLDYARETPSDRTALNLNDVIRQTTQLLGNRQAFQHVHIRQLLDENLPPVDGDFGQLQQVFLNLALNACEAMPDGGTLEIVTSLDRDRVVVRVADTGGGIRPEHLGKIFDPFFTTKPEGTGLGLAISHGIVHDHHGTLDVRSEVGKGSTFTLTLPLEAAPGA